MGLAPWVGRAMGIVDKVMDFRLNIDTEFQGWILLFSTLTAVWVCCLPCVCAGSPHEWIRRKAAWISMRLPYWFIFSMFVDAVFLFFVITWLPDWGYGDYIKCVAGLAGYLLKNVMKGMVSIAFIVIAVFVFAFKDRFLKLAGVDYKTTVRFKLRDIFGGAQTRAIELRIWKVEDLPNPQVWAPNNVFIEVHMGYNEPMKTRVHNNAGSSCVLKEAIQLNFDEQEDEEPLFLFVKNQKVMGAGELARMELKAEDVAQHMKGEARKGGDGWSDASMERRQLVPRGQIWFQVRYIDDEEALDSMRC